MPSEQKVLSYNIGAYCSSGKEAVYVHNQKQIHRRNRSRGGFARMRLSTVSNPEAECSQLGEKYNQMLRGSRSWITFYNQWTLLGKYVMCVKRGRCRETKNVRWDSNMSKLVCQTKKNMDFILTTMIVHCAEERKNINSILQKKKLLASRTNNTANS